jgi:hypothetical protein
MQPSSQSILLTQGTAENESYLLNDDKSLSFWGNN